jgi:hypothetical protein
MNLYDGLRTPKLVYARDFFCAANGGNEYSVSRLILWYFPIVKGSHNLISLEGFLTDSVLPTVNPPFRVMHRQIFVIALIFAIITAR